MISFAKSSLFLRMLSSLAAPINTSGLESVEWAVLDTRLPQKLSDNSATFLPRISDDSKLSGDRIVIVGGCNSPKGNTYVDATGAVLDFFICESITDRAYAFNPNDGTFTRLADAPRARYRHAAAQIDGRVWLVGGRTVPEDSVIAEIDVYDPVTDSWSTPGSLPTDYLTSDNGAFSDRNGAKLYVVGGYNPTYDNPSALATTFTVDVREALTSNNIVIEEKASMQTQRGDIHAVAVHSADDSVAYVTGGFSMYPCEPLKTVERYDIEADAWTYMDGMNSARGDKALVQLNGKVFAVGGETTPRNQCSENPEDVPPLSAQSVAVDDVEMFDPASSSSAGGAVAWTKIDDIPNFRFRFSGAAWDETDTIYTFGGQVGFDDDCKCYATSDTITAYQFSDDGYSGSSGRHGTLGIMTAVAGAAFGAMMFV